jgi:hypothetical protein
MEETQILEPITLGNLSHLGKTHLNEINNFFWNLIKWTYKQHQLCHSLHFLESISIDKDMYINALKVKLEKPTIFL